MSTVRTEIHTGTRATRPSGRQKAGLILSLFLCVTNLPSVLYSAPSGEVGPPFGIMLVCTVLSAVGLVATVLAWRGSALAKRVAAGCLVVITLTSLPAFFVDVSMGIKVLSGVGVLLAILTVALMFAGPRRVSAAPAPR